MMADEQGPTEEQGAEEVFGDANESMEQKLLTTIANFIVQWSHFSKSGGICFSVDFENGRVTAAQATSQEVLAGTEGS